jgi:hypothetical protein
MKTFVKCSTYFSFPIHCINTTNPIQPNYSDNWKYDGISKSCLNSLLYRFLRFSFTSIPSKLSPQNFPFKRNVYFLYTQKALWVVMKTWHMVVTLNLLKAANFCASALNVLYIYRIQLPLSNFVTFSVSRHEYFWLLSWRRRRPDQFLTSLYRQWL